MSLEIRVSPELDLPSKQCSQGQNDTTAKTRNFLQCRLHRSLNHSSAKNKQTKTKRQNHIEKLTNSAND